MTTPSRNVERTELPHDLIPGLGAGNFGTVGKLADCLDEGIPIEASLPASEILCRPSENICEIELSGDTKTDAPFWLGHEGLFDSAGNDLLGEAIQIGLQVFDIFELFELAQI